MMKMHEALDIAGSVIKTWKIKSKLGFGASGVTSGVRAITTVTDT